MRVLLCLISVPAVVLFFPVVKEISELLNTGLDDETLKVCLQLLEAGVNPEALATVVTELRKETSALMVSSLTTSPTIAGCHVTQGIRSYHPSG